ncbi:MAG: hypothetical protein KatS3mg110_3966 [Pirellulaceae bacterium]|nr:MAG: hypothetical protein KatS3mg110_3966 [Pirellulaceae bacterium]
MTRMNRKNGTIRPGGLGRATGRESGVASRREFLRWTILGTSCLICERLEGQPAGIRWYDVTSWGVEGRGWADQERQRYFDRLPAKAEGRVRPAVWGLSRHSAGMAALFATDATQIYVRCKLYSSRLAMPHMPATGVSGLDLYARDMDGNWRWVQVVQPTAQKIDQLLAGGVDPGGRTYLLYLPLYNGVDSLELGVPDGASFTPIVPRQDRPIVFYGTSIIQGACASRPGMALPAIVGRRLDVPTINLGFSGNGRMDPPVVELLAELDAEIFCIDCLPNMQPEMVRERTEPLVRRLRESHPQTPILLVEDRWFTNSRFYESRRKFHEANHAALREAYRKLEADGIENLYYLHGHLLLGDDGEAATDGSHPNDLGFMRYADAYLKVIQQIRKEMRS